jgi:hypothetical protein
MAKGENSHDLLFGNYHVAQRFCAGAAYSPQAAARMVVAVRAV